MNKVFKVIWNHATQTWTAVSELGHAKGKTKSKKIVKLTALAGSIVSALGVSQMAEAAASRTAYLENYRVAISPAADGEHAKAANAGSTNAIAIGLGATADTGFADEIDAATKQPKSAGSIAIGLAASAKPVGDSKANSAVAIGDHATASSEAAVALGAFNSATGSNTISLGSRANATANNAIAAGTKANAIKDNGVAVGAYSEAKEERSTAVGVLAQAEGQGSFAGGASARATGTNSVAIGGSTDGDIPKGKTGDELANAKAGTAAKATGAQSIAIGTKSKAIDENTIAQGNTATANKESDIAIGTSSVANGTRKSQTSCAKTNPSLPGGATCEEGTAIAVGKNSNATGYSAISVGKDSSASFDHAIAIGDSANATHIHSVAIGSAASAQMMVRSQVVIMQLHQVKILLL